MKFGLKLNTLAVAAVESAAPDAKGGKGGKAPPPKAAAKEEPVEPVFAFHPPEMTLKVDETQELTVFAFPREPVPSEDFLVCECENSPNKVEFPLAVVGEKPKVELSADRIAFDRLLLEHRDSKTFSVRNVSQLPLKWRLVGAEALPEELSVSPLDGTLSAQTEQEVTVTFAGKEKKVVDSKLALQVLDVDELQGVAQEVPLPITAEAYEIEVKPRYPAEADSGINYVLVKVLFFLCVHISRVRNAPHA